MGDSMLNPMTTTPQPSSAPRKVVIILAATLGLLGCVVLLSGQDHAAAPATVGTTLTSTQLSSKSEKRAECMNPCPYQPPKFQKICGCPTTDLISKSEICRNHRYSNFWKQLGCSPFGLGTTTTTTELSKCKMPCGKPCVKSRFGTQCNVK